MTDTPLPSDEGWVRLAALDRLPCGRAVQVDIDGQQVALFHTEGGLRAIDGLRTGQRQDREGQAIHVYPTRIVDDWIWLAVLERR